VPSSSVRNVIVSRTLVVDNYSIESEKAILKYFYRVFSACFSLLERIKRATSVLGTNNSANQKVFLARSRCACAKSRRLTVLSDFTLAQADGNLSPLSLGIRCLPLACPRAWVIGIHHPLRRKPGRTMPGCYAEMARWMPGSRSKFAQYTRARRRSASSNDQMRSSA